MILHVPAPERMRALGEALGRAAIAGDLFLLEGPFGAGKTTFVQGLAVGLEVATPVSSPTFVIETQYRGRLTLYHVDLYRLEQVEPELWASLGEDLFDQGVAAVEWAEKLPPDLRAGGHLLRFDVGDQERVIEFETAADRLLGAVKDV